MMFVQAVLASNEGNLVYLELGPGSVKEVAHWKAPAEVACLDMTPLSTSADAAQPATQQQSHMVAVGTWAQQLLILALPDLQPLQEADLGGQVH